MKDKVIKGLRFLWFFELMLFIGGFYIVYRYFYSEPGMTRQQKAQQTAPAVEETILETAVVSIDVDEEKQKPLLAKGTFSKYIDYLYCFTEISGKIPDVIIHYWMHEDNIVAQKRLSLSANDPITWSKMNMTPEQTGSWRVDVRTGDGVYLGSANFVLK